MSEHHVCPVGHEWDDSELGSATPVNSCPVCGAAEQHLKSLDKSFALSTTPDELPPPPLTAATPSRSVSDHEPATSIGDYQILAELGRGGMGVVYRARQISLNRTVALKMILAGEYASPELRSRFRNEAETVARLQHPNIVQIHEVAEQNGRTFFSLEYVDGESLAQQLAGQRLAPMRAAELIRTLARAMQYAHERSVIHRDLKPANVLIAADGTPKIADFGLARLLDKDSAHTRSGSVLGTPSYMAPEQTRGEIHRIGPVTDVYALGAVLYECLTGRPPFRAASPLETARQVLTEEPVPPARLQPGLPRDLETICLKCLQKDPVRRYGSAAEFADDLDRFLRSEPVRARPVSAVERGWKWVRRRPAVAAVWVVSFVAAIALAAILISANARLQLERNAAQASSDAAIDAVNRHFTLVSEDLLLNAPHMAPVRRQLLQKAKDYYEQFVAARCDDPRLRAELGRSCARLGKITWQMGSKDVAEAHYLRSIEILHALAQEQPDVPHRFELASAWNELGGLYVAQRELAPATHAFRNAIQLAEQLPLDDADYLQVLGQCLHGLGEMHRLSGQAEQAENQFRKALAAHKRAVEARPDSPKFRRDLAHTQHNLGVVAQTAGRWSEAEKEYVEALALRESLARHHPNVPQFQSAAAASLLNLGWLYYMTGRTSEANSPWSRVLAIQEKLALTFPDVVVYQVELAEALSNLGSLNLATERWEASRKLYEEALRIRHLLVERFPQDAEHRDGLALAHNNLGALLGSAGDFVKAEGEFTAAAHIREALTKEQPDVAKYRLDLGHNCTNLAKLKQSNGDNESALIWFDRGIVAFEGVLSKEAKHAQARANLVIALVGRAEARLALKRMDAIADWERAAQLDDAPNLNQWLVRRAHALGQLGKHVEALQEAEKLAIAETFSGESLYFLACTFGLASSELGAEPAWIKDSSARAIEMLKRAQAAGYFKDATRIEEMKKNADLKALRPREDFQQWLATITPP